MKYYSTRNKANTINSMDAIKHGIAADGGLYVPDSSPAFNEKFFREILDYGYADIASKVLAEFLTDFSLSDIHKNTSEAYNTDVFTSPLITPVKKLSEELYVLELWHGPTCAFKDLALQLLPGLMRTILASTGEEHEMVVLVATSGDTGKAALEGFKNVPQTKIMVFYPDDGVSNIQKLQMITQDGNNVHVAAIKGNFDDAQAAVKAIFADEELGILMNRNGMRFTSANSINWGRLVPQIVYYIYAYIIMLKNKWLSEHESFNIAVPTGNFGNILAAFYAKQSGLPVDRLICASNSNRVLADFINTGIYDANREFHSTMSPSMDILVSSNLERLLFELSCLDDVRIRNLMADFKESKRFDIGTEAKKRLQSEFWGGWADESQTLNAIKSMFCDMDYTIDPHTAVAKWVLDDYRKKTKDTKKCLLLSTASPFKFSKSVLKAITGKDQEENADEFALLNKLSNISGMSVPRTLFELKEKKIIHKTNCAIEQIKAAVTNMLGLR